MSEPPVAASPVALLEPDATVEGWAVSTRRVDGELLLSDASPLSRVLIRCSPDRAPEALVAIAAGSARWDADGLIASPAPGEWQAYGAPGQRADLVERWQASARAGAGSVVDVTHASACLWLRGRSLNRLLSHVCALDVAGLPAAAATRTSVAGVTTDVVLSDAGADPSCLLACGRSYGAYLAASLLEEGAGLGLQASGFQVPWVRDVRAGPRP